MEQKTTNQQVQQAQQQASIPPAPFEKQPEFQFPTEEVTLPSKGLLYPPTSPLRSGKVRMKYMTAKEEDILTNQNYIKGGTVIDKLLQSLIVDMIKVDELLIGDKNALLVAARILGYGSDYEFKYINPETGEEEDVSVDLTFDIHFDDGAIAENVTIPIGVQFFWPDASV